MVRVVGPLQSVQARGSLHEITFRHSRGVAVVTRKGRPTGEPTFMQQTVQARMGVAQLVTRLIRARNVGISGTTEQLIPFYRRRVKPGEAWTSPFVRGLTQNRAAVLEQAIQDYPNLQEPVMAAWDNRGESIGLGYVTWYNGVLNPGAVALAIQRLALRDGYIGALNENEPLFFTEAPGKNL